VTTLPVSQGGLGCFSIPEYLASFRVKILRRVLSLNAPWCMYWRYRLGSSSGSWNLSAIDLIRSAIPSTQLKLPSFWISVVKAGQALFPFYPDLPILLEPLFINEKPLFQAHWKLIHQKGFANYGKWKIFGQFKR